MASRSAAGGFLTPFDVSQENTQVLTPDECLDSVRHFAAGMNMVARRDGDDLAIDLHLSVAAHDVVILVERALLVVIIEIMGVDPFAGAGRNGSDQEVCRPGCAIEPEELGIDAALAPMNSGKFNPPLASLSLVNVAVRLPPGESGAVESADQASIFWLNIAKKCRPRRSHCHG